MIQCSWDHSFICEYVSKKNFYPVSHLVCLAFDVSKQLIIPFLHNQPNDEPADCVFQGSRDRKRFVSRTSDAAVDSGNLVNIFLKMFLKILWCTQMLSEKDRYYWHVGFQASTSSFKKSMRKCLEVNSGCDSTGCKKKWDCLEVYEKMTPLLTWFITSVYWFQVILCS